MVPLDPSAPVRESELSQRLKDTQSLYAQHKSLRPRVDSVRQRFEKIRSLEEEGKERLTSAWTALERVALLAESNPMLEKISAEEIGKLGEEIRELGNELNTQDQGEIDKKVQRINAQADKVSRSMNSWLSQLNTMTADCAKQINDRLIQLDAAAALDDPPVQEARTVLAREDFAPPQKTGLTERNKAVARISAVARSAIPEREPALPLLDATAEIKRKNDLWQTLNSIQIALEEKSAPVLEAHQEVVKARGEARDRLAELAEHVPDRRAWPPSNQTPLPEAEALRPADERWETVKKQRGHSEWAIQEMGRVAQQFRLVAERASQTLAWAEQEQERVQELEWQIKDVKERWQAQAQTDPNNPVMREGVQQLISQTDSKLAYIKHQFMRNSITYEQVIQNLQLLYDETFSTRISVDEGSEIGINDISRPAEQNNLS
jgi:hypothetical protein